MFNETVSTQRLCSRDRIRSLLVSVIQRRGLKDKALLRSLGSTTGGRLGCACRGRRSGDVCSGHAEVKLRQPAQGGRGVTTSKKERRKVKKNAEVKLCGRSSEVSPLAKRKPRSRIKNKIGSKQVLSCSEQQTENETGMQTNRHTDTQTIPQTDSRTDKRRTNRRINNTDR
jgi:hypothetical protein